MGTNYYFVGNVCECCGRGDEALHIGKSSAGWSFSFHGTDEIRSYRDWLKKLETGKIVDEYGDESTLEIFKALVCAKMNGRNQVGNEGLGLLPSWFDEEGNAFYGYEFS